MRAAKTGRGGHRSSGLKSNGHRAHRKQKTTPDPGVRNECGLIAFRTRRAARHALRRNLRGAPLRERRCDACGLFHHFRKDEALIRGERTAGERFGTPLTFSAEPVSGPVPPDLGLTPARMAEILTPKCQPCGKRMYPDEQSADRARAYFTALYGKAYRLYWQKSCGSWHTTEVLTKEERRAKRAAKAAAAQGAARAA